MNEEQGSLVYDILDALGELVRALGGPKKVGQRLRPELPMEQAAQWVRDCLNANRREKFDPAQVLFLLKWGRQTNCHTAIEFINQDAGYTKPLPVDPKDEALALMQREERLVAELRNVLDRRERLAATPIRVVK